MVVAFDCVSATCPAAAIECARGADDSATGQCSPDVAADVIRAVRILGFRSRGVAMQPVIDGVAFCHRCDDGRDIRIGRKRPRLMLEHLVDPRACDAVVHRAGAVAAGALAAFRCAMIERPTAAASPIGTAFPTSRAIGSRCTGAPGGTNS